jgi:hypothetical protein
MTGFCCFGVLRDQGAHERLVWLDWIEAWLKRLLFGPLAVMKVAFLCFGRNQTNQFTNPNRAIILVSPWTTKT